MFPLIEKLPTDVQVAFISVLFNRGPALGHDPDWRTAKEVDRRWEMRKMREDIKRQDFFAIYAHLGTMKRLWESAGPRGLLIRRRDEQALIRPYVNRQLQWEQKQEALKNAGLSRCSN
jgi:GH24 family phage-related lysozyme (muramidase)